MKITKNTVVTVKYKLMDAQNNLLLESDEPIVYLHGDYDDVLPILEKSLDGKENGYKSKMQVEPEDAFGEYDPLLLRVEDRDKFPKDLQEGMQFEGIPGEPDTQEHIYTVTDITEDKVVLEGNHPLAGMALRFELEVLDVREATPEEVKRGYMNNPEGFEVDEAEEDGQYRSMFVH